jgi:hypothetical protein
MRQNGVNMAKKALLRLIAAAFLIGASLLTVNAVAKNDTNFKEMVTGTYGYADTLYMSPISSVIYVDGTGELYIIDRKALRFTILYEDTGAVKTEYTFVPWRAKNVTPEDWDALFMEGLRHKSIDKYKTRLEYLISDRYSLYQMDDEIWLGFKRSQKDGLGAFMSLIRIELVDSNVK